MTGQQVTKADSSLKQLHALASGTFPFDANLPVSTTSRFGDAIWDWTDPRNKRLLATAKSRLRFNWAEITLGTSESLSRNGLKLHHQHFLPLLPAEIVEDLKRAFFIIALLPSLSNKRAHALKATTITEALRLCSNFFSHLYSESPKARAQINKLSDITLSHIRTGIETFPYAIGRLRRMLTWLTSEPIQLNLKYGRLQWSRHDLKTLKWPPRKEYQSIETLPDGLFALLSNKSCDW
jgi:hypothetical protein